MTTIAVIDYGMGNLHSVAKALEHVATNHRIVVSSDPAQILAADRVVLPGVGAIRDCVGELRRLGLDKVLAEVIQQGKPLLAVCVGMQVLLQFSAENGGTDCLDILPGRLEFFGDAFVENPPGEHLKVPHMGWNQVHQTDPEHSLWQGIAQDSSFYFVHSYFLPLVQAEEICAATTEYGQAFCSAVSRGNIFATQFHPEKSAAAGLRLYANFLDWNGE
jgi:glutamine amidotransferase